uniref:Uncharacterized protein n=1 Tax=Enterobacter cloacae TaxID=550 RepID=A0A2L1KN79_ENTCL|nr:hypothetical protein [Enterobacter cloacae]
MRSPLFPVRARTSTGEIFPDWITLRLLNGLREVGLFGSGS